MARIGPTIHASAVLIGAHAILIRGPTGSGKSRLALNLIQSVAHGPLAFVRLVADDRVHVQAAHGRLVARAPVAIAGLLEIRGIGIQHLPYEPVAAVSWVVDLGEAGTQRMPDGAAMTANIEGIELPRLAVAPGRDPFPMVLAVLTSGSVSAMTACPDHARSGSRESQSTVTAGLRARSG
jgi:HPr kinase/phosphorylase